MAVLCNEDQWETSNVDVDGDLVTRYEKGALPRTHRFIDYGMLWFRRTAFEMVVAGRNGFDLSVVVEALIEKRRLGAFVVGERFRDIGNEDVWRETDGFVRNSDFWQRLIIQADAGNLPSLGTDDDSN